MISTLSTVDSRSLEREDSTVARSAEEFFCESEPSLLKEIIPEPDRHSNSQDVEDIFDSRARLKGRFLHSRDPKRQETTKICTYSSWRLYTIRQVALYKRPCSVEIMHGGLG